MKDKLYVLIDTEFTSFPNRKGEVFDVAFVFTDGERMIDQFQSLIKMDEEGVDLAIKHIGKIVSIDKDAILSAPTDIEVCEMFMGVIEKYNKQFDLYLVGYNVYFDYLSICITLRRASKKYFDRFIDIFPREKNIDAKILAKKLFPTLSGYSLSNVCKELCIAKELTEKRDVEKHSALLDTIILFKLFVKIKEENYRKNLCLV